MAATDRARSALEVERRLAELLERCEHRVARLGKSVREKLPARWPGLLELVVYFYENQGALVLSCSPTVRGAKGVCALALRPEELRLCFGRGAELASSDPRGLSKGRGMTMRYVVLSSVADFERADVQRLLTVTWKLAGLQLDPRPRGCLLFKLEPQAQRVRRMEAARWTRPRVGTPRDRR